mgnify:CR=1 FL=1
MESRTFAKQLRRTMTDAEHRLWKHLRAHRLDGQKFRRQQPIGPYVVDFVHFGVRLIVEADGGQHADAPHDKVRDAWLQAQIQKSRPQALEPKPSKVRPLSLPAAVAILDSEGA